MRFTIVVFALPFLLVGQAGEDLDVIPLGGMACPLVGDAKSPVVKDLNRLKNRYHSPVSSDIDPTVTLTAMIAPGDDENRFDSKSAATVSGFVLEVKEGSVETCNCRATKPSERDTHIYLTLTDGAGKDQSVIAEVTPRMRILRQRAGKNDWSTDELKRNLQGNWVELSGWLMFDLEHVDQAENTNPGNANNVRATCWEIHPVTTIKVVGPPAQAVRVAPAAVAAFQRAQAAQMNAVPRRKQFIQERIEKYRKMFAEDERDVVDPAQ